MRNAHYRLVSCVTLLAALAACSETPTPPTGPTASSSPDAAQWRSLAGVRHVFVIVLENEGYDSTFGRPSAAPYLADTLVHAGRLLRQYYGIAHNSLPNYLAMIAGVSPTLATQADCPIYQNFLMTGTAPDGQPIGQGCIYPAGVPTVANQLEASGRSWKGYMEDMGNNPLRESATCGHVPIGAPDLTTTATPTDQYAQRHDPFVYFHAILDSPTCAHNCGEVSGPNTPHAGGTGPGGGRVGAVLLSPSITPGSLSDTPYNHYGLLRTIEDVFGLSHLGYAGAAGVSSFELR